MKTKKIIFARFVVRLLWGAMLGSIFVIASQAQDLPGSTWKYYNTPGLSQMEIMALALDAARNPAHYVGDATREIEDLSRRMEDHIAWWLPGKGPAEFPEGFFSEWIDNEKTHDRR